MSVTVRYFAAAAEAAGRESETFDVSTVGDLRDAVVRAHGADLERVLGRCSLLADGVRAQDDSMPLAPGVTVDVLPPFAGG